MASASDPDEKRPLPQSQPEGPVNVGESELFSDTLENLAERADETERTFNARSSQHVQKAFGHSVEFSSAWAATLAALDQAQVDGPLSSAQQKTVLNAYLYDFLGSVYRQPELRQLETNIQRLLKRDEPERENLERTQKRGLKM